ncbi:PepSY domain-containing protein [Cognatiyoonia koreensis]|nr:hypothetical protein [Cognatiyoonia koreensis]
MTNANAAIARGEAKSLREVFSIVQNRYPGRLIRVGFNGARGGSEYWIQMVTPNGTVQTVTVDALSGATLGVRGC